MLTTLKLNSYVSPYIKKIDGEIRKIISPEYVNHIAKNISFGGKRIRPIILILTANLLGGRLQETIIKSAISIELIHLASLLHDDVIDGGTLRHSKPAAHTLFGNQQVILGGDFLFAESFKQIVETQNLKIIEIVAKASITLASGELEQLQTKINHATSREKYFEIIYKKTASLFEVSTGIAAIIQGVEEGDAMEFGKNIGMAFQIIDDIIDYSSNSTGKNIGTDFLEGKVTLPIILASQNNKSQAILQELFNKADKNLKDLEAVTEILVKENALSESKNIALEYIEKSKYFIKHIRKSDESELILELMDFFLKRIV